MTPSEEFVKRYATIERQADALGRIIGVHRLKVSQQVKISEMTPGLEGNAELTMADGAVRIIPRRGLPMLAAAVCEIDGVPIPFPKSRAELDAIMDRLDEEGLAAVVKASIALNPSAVLADGEVTENGIDQAKK